MLFHEFRPVGSDAYKSVCAVDLQLEIVHHVAELAGEDANIVAAGFAHGEFFILAEIGVESSQRTHHVHVCFEHGNHITDFFSPALEKLDISCGVDMVMMAFASRTQNCHFSLADVF
jgi:hypothetical protein